MTPWMRVFVVIAALISIALSFTAGPSWADRRYFLQSYTPYLPAPGNLELETTTIAQIGRGDSTGAAWRNRIEFEFGATDRLGGAVYLNFVQPNEAGAASTFDGPSLEFIYRLAEPGRPGFEPAAYLEIRANGEELELEPKLLLARRFDRTVAVLNLVGEIEHFTAGPESGETEKEWGITAGASRELGATCALGAEARYTRTVPDQGSASSALLVGPTINFQSPKLQVGLGWHVQVSGQPDMSGGLNLDEFPRHEVRLLLGVSL